MTLRDIGAQSARIGLLAVASTMRGTRTSELDWCHGRSLWAAMGGYSNHQSASDTARELFTLLIGYIEDLMIPFNVPPVVGTELSFIQTAIGSGKLCGDGSFTQRCQQWLEQRFGSAKVLLTPSCTASLEMAAILLNIHPGDEVIMPSYTFASTANAFVLRGATIVFVDIRPDTLNIDETLIEAAITPNTRSIVPVHYAGVACEMDTIMAIAKQHRLWVVEDAAQGVMATYKGRALGTLGHIGCFSFHETKNYTSGGEGGAILINNAAFIEQAEIIREKGTNRSQFFRKKVDKYTWYDIGSSYLMADLQAAYLWAQLEAAETINLRRLTLWNRYYVSLAQQDSLAVPVLPDTCQHNSHMFYLKLSDINDRNSFIRYMKSVDILTVFHYIPLHSSPAGQRFGRFHGSDRYTSRESQRLVRLPLFYNLKDSDQQRVIDAICGYYI
ncbi:MAG: dTDP-4-dehydro-6-deoxy-D-glucose transaminase [Sodalis sp. Psp]|nr:dTDP-4-dehydro-6-deoxy-D-glucose transaminase [Sodalis sp. Psp]MCR3756836.1 dTDP-4-dehydro-6-deoxy-D-glucose transaminase [Sodalis sp. Ppy]